MTTPFPLGRRLEPNHDPKSRGFQAFTAPALTKARHRLYGRPLDQGQLGSCTGNAAAHLLNTAPFHRPRHRLYYEPAAVLFYSQATQIDPFDGQYPPEDTGSDGLSVCKAIQALGKISWYRHAFGIDQALHALVLSPVITGIPWFDGMFDPDQRGFVWPTGRIVGGHEICVNEIVPDPSHSGGGYVGFVQSWGTSWGLHGRGRMTFHTWDQLLRMDGDVTVPTP